MSRSELGVRQESGCAALLFERILNERRQGSGGVVLMGARGIGLMRGDACYHRDI